MELLYLIGQNEGGFPHYAAELANAMTNHAEVTVLKPSRTTADDAFSDAVRVVDAFEPLELSLPKLYAHEFNVRENLRAMWSYRNVRRVHEIDPDVVHDPTALLPYVKLCAGRYGIDDRYPLVVTRHEVPAKRFPLSRPPELAENLVHALLPGVKLARTIVHTRDQRTALLARGYDADEVEVIPHGSYDLFTRYDYEERPEEESTLLFFGNVIPSKGLDTLAEAAVLASEDVPDVKLIVAGTGSLSESTRRLVERHEERFELHDYFVPNDEVGELFSRATAAVMPYRDEDGTKGHSGALATAFSFGKPVVTSSVGEFPLLAERAGAGLVVPPDRPRRLANALVSVLRNDGLRAELARNSRKQAAALSWERIAERHLDLYESVLDSDR
jgi:glycosyltransferase involved in cell wall biosynthesis